jgi:hypothetical protein
MFGYGDNHARPFTLELKVVVEPGRPWKLMAEPPLEEQIRDAVRDMATQAEVLRAGRIYCYHCDSAECPHSVPPRPSSVFGGYSATGLPRWPELAQVMLDLKHPKVDLLYQTSGQDVAAAFMEADLLKCRQLNVFGRLSKTYDILGQVVFGFLYLKPRDEHFPEPQRVAFTLQAVETRRLDGSPRLELNVLGRLWDGTSAIDAMRGPYQMRILQLITDARRRIQQMNPRGKRGKSTSARLKADIPARAMHILREMARSLERIGRQTGRRTAHAEERRDGNRPTSKAWEDAASASMDHILWDVHRHTVVVLGSRNRVHVFSPEGRHVTSLLLEGEAIRSRLRRERWRPLLGETLEQFSAAVGRRDDKTPRHPSDTPASEHGNPQRHCLPDEASPKTGNPKFETDANDQNRNDSNHT